MYAHRHKIIHDIVLVSNRVEDLIDQRLLLLCRDLNKPKVVVFISAEGRQPRKEFAELACDEHFVIIYLFFSLGWKLGLGLVIWISNIFVIME